MIFGFTTMPEYINQKGDTEWKFFYDDVIGMWKLQSWKNGEDEPQAHYCVNRLNFVADSAKWVHCGTQGSTSEIRKGLIDEIQIIYHFSFCGYLRYP